MHVEPQYTPLSQAIGVLETRVVRLRGDQVVSAKWVRFLVFIPDHATEVDLLVWQSMSAARRRAA